MRYSTWKEFLLAQRRSGLLGRISEFVTAERAASDQQMPVDGDLFRYGPAVYPSSADVFNFTLTPLRDVKVVILGQDPYHGPGQAHGLAFSVPRGVKVPPSLTNIFKELYADIGQVRRTDLRSPETATLHGDLTAWTRQGVLLLNTALTVRQAEPGSHLGAWQPFTDEVVRCVVDSADVAPHFVLWGSTLRRR